MPKADPNRFAHLPLVRGQLIEVRPGRRLSVAVHQGNRDTVVFLGHGSGGNKDQWRELWRNLSEQGYTLVAWDLLGHGDSDKPRDANAYAWDELVADNLAVLKRYAGPRNLYVAHSYGTGLAMSTLLALARQQSALRIDGALLLGSVLHRPVGTGGLLSLPNWLLTILRPILAKDFRARAWHPEADPALVDYEDGLAQRNRLDVFKALMNNAQWPDAQALAGLDVPVYVVSGETDGLTPASGGEALARHLPNAHYQVLPCGHQLMLECPEQVLQAFERLAAHC